MKTRDAQNRRAMSSSALPTAANTDIMEVTDSSDEEFPDCEQLVQEISSQKTVKRLESMKLEDDGFEMTDSHSPSPGSFLYSHSHPAVG